MSEKIGVSDVSRNFVSESFPSVRMLTRLRKKSGNRSL
jgi:hypothetical protein